MFEKALERQIRTARMRRELRELEAEEAAGRNFVARAVEPRRLDFTEFQATVYRFSSDDAYDVMKWFDDLEYAFAVFGCSERDKCVSRRRLLDGTAKMFLRTITSHTYVELINRLVAKFGKSYTMADVFQQLKTPTL